MSRAQYFRDYRKKQREFDEKLKQTIKDILDRSNKGTKSVFLRKEEREILEKVVA